MKATLHTNPFKLAIRKCSGLSDRKVSMKWKLSVALAFINTVSADPLLERTPADACGGRSLHQHPTPEAAKGICRIPVAIADGPFDGTWKSFSWAPRRRSDGLGRMTRSPSIALLPSHPPSPLCSASTFE
jgi:hypothetical protein